MSPSMDVRTKPEATMEKTGPRDAKPAHARRRRLPLGLILAALALLAAAWYLFRPQPLRTELATATIGPMQVTVDNQGRVRIRDSYVLAAPVTARMARVALRDGDAVQRGQVLATLYPLPLDPRAHEGAQARLEAAQALLREAGLRAARADADLRLAVSERERAKRLAGENFLSAQAADKAIAAEAASRAEWEAARSRQAAAAADVRAAEAALIAADGGAKGDARAAEAALIAADGGAKGDARALPLLSPVDGYVLKVHEKSERIVAAGTPLVSVADASRYEIVVDVLSSDAVKVRPGQTMLLEGWGGARTLRATVRLVEPAAFTKISALGVEEQRVNVIADPVDALGPLGDAYRVEARIVVWETQRALRLPGSSVFRVGDAWHVFIVEGGRAHEREVRIGQRNQDEAQVLAGVSAGSVVVRYPGNALKDGARIEPAQ
ncbi:efflux RND transporter periplasmic adaptor subunit [Noviherbaspirillum pedocola]|uniref:HlyD family efflux transporter periplasmic adaptor subunit n=1 Tax=Noviherbaspirillum pedocola TaxID=2801341 RepID=A0A934W7T0_9BURK|nr:HlyD family efflux transporter periplasmic adaptor subunit [Noviherbaspirillum pedocola]MBK4735024.1 HlyD family efflux transporter periplasmic adaptor subunit [Noviherbaspirillum pedocola]